MWLGRTAAILVLAFAFYTLFDKPSNKVIQKKQIVEAVHKSSDKSINPEVKKIPVDPNKKDTEELQKITPKTEVRKVIPRQKSDKNIRESIQRKITHEDVEINRTTLEVLAELNSITASLNIQQPSPTLATMHIIIPGNTNYYEERLLGDIIKEKAGLDKFRFNKITKAGLNLVSSISNDKFKYQTNKEGRVTLFSYNSRLLAFSIPTKNEDTGE